MLTLALAFLLRVVTVVLVFYLLYGLFFNTRRLWLHIAAGAALSTIVAYRVAVDLDVTSGIVVGVAMFLFFAAAFLGRKKHQN